MDNYTANTSNSYMNGAGFHQKIDASECAIELMDHLLEPVVLYLPIWSEGAAKRTIIDFEVGYTNLEAYRKFHISALTRIRMPARQFFIYICIC